MRIMETTALMSFEEFERLDTTDDIELLDGELIRLPMPQNLHMDSAERLFELLKPAVEQLRKSRPDLPLGRVHIERGYFFPGDPKSWLRPDVSLTHPNQRGDRFFENAPLIAFEVVSENETIVTMSRKTAKYFAKGAAEVWYLNPYTRDALVYRGSLDAIMRVTDAIRTPLLPGIEIPLTAIWSA